MGVSIDDIKKLKELSGIGLTDAKLALVEANGNFDNFVVMPFNDGALDQAGVGQKKGPGRVSAFDAGLFFWGKFSPTGAFSIQYFFPSRHLEPLVKRLFRKTLFLKVVEDKVITLLA